MTLLVVLECTLMLSKDLVSESNHCYTPSKRLAMYVQNTLMYVVYCRGSSLGALPLPFPLPALELSTSSSLRYIMLLISSMLNG